MIDASILRYQYRRMCIERELERCARMIAAAQRMVAEEDARAVPPHETQSELIVRITRRVTAATFATELEAHVAKLRIAHRALDTEIRRRNE